jgi:hypothetical protein
MIPYYLTSLDLFPKDLTIYEILLGIIPVFALIIAALYYVFKSINDIKTRKAQLFADLYTQFRDFDFMKRWSECYFQWEWKDFDEFIERYGPQNNIEAFALYTSICAYFEGIGVLTKNKLIDITMVDELMATPIIWMWEKTEAITKGYRINFDNPNLWEWYEYLYHKLKKRQRQNKIQMK